MFIYNETIEYVNDNEIVFSLDSTEAYFNRVYGDMSESQYFYLSCRQRLALFPPNLKPDPLKIAWRLSLKLKLCIYISGLAAVDLDVQIPLTRCVTCSYKPLELSGYHAHNAAQAEMNVSLSYLY